jgi:hypothetical protein
MERAPGEELRSDCAGLALHSEAMIGYLYICEANICSWWKIVGLDRCECQL